MNVAPVILLGRYLFRWVSRSTIRRTTPSTRLQRYVTFCALHDPNVHFLCDDVQEESHLSTQSRFLVQSVSVDELVSNFQNSPFSIFLVSQCCSQHSPQFQFRQSPLTDSFFEHTAGEVSASHTWLTKATSSRRRRARPMH